MSVPRFEKVPLVQVADVENREGVAGNPESPMSPQVQKLHEKDMVPVPIFSCMVLLYTKP